MLNKRKAFDFLESKAFLLPIRFSQKDNLYLRSGYCNGGENCKKLN